MASIWSWPTRPLILYFFVTLQGYAVLGGPDHRILSVCTDLYKVLNPDERHAARDLVQALQAVDSYSGHLRFGRPLPLSSVPKEAPNVTLLEQWKTGNESKLYTLLEGTGASAQLGGRDAAASLARTCLSSRLHPDGFTSRPTVSILLNYFKRPQVVSRISANMRASCEAAAMPCELVVNVDNPHEAAAWAAEAAASGGFVVPVFSANLHEARGYNRAARLARGRYLVVWQDDQVPPSTGQWLVDMVRVFDAYPQLGVLGMNTHRLCKHTEPTNRFGTCWWAPDEKTGVRWTYAQTVDFAPLAIRASIFHAIGGLDEGLARQGDCGIWGDWELSVRAWMDGWQVGFTYLEGRSGDGQPGSTHVGANGEKCWGRQQHVASSVFHRRFGADWLQDLMCERVRLLNLLTFKVESGRCPYGVGETKYGNCTVPPPDVVAAAKAELAEIAEALRLHGAGSSSGGGGSSSSGGGDVQDASGASSEEGFDVLSGTIEINPVIVRGRSLRTKLW